MAFLSGLMSVICCVVLRIRNILVRIRFRIRGSVPLTNGPDPDPDIVIDLQDATKNYFFQIFSAYYFLKAHIFTLFYHFSKIKVIKVSLTIFAR